MHYSHKNKFIAGIKRKDLQSTRGFAFVSPTGWFFYAFASARFPVGGHWGTTLGQA
jgi:hypothetical protein